MFAVAGLWIPRIETGVTISAFAPLSRVRTPKGDQGHQAPFRLGLCLQKFACLQNFVCEFANELIYLTTKLLWKVGFRAPPYIKMASRFDIAASSVR